MADLRSFFLAPPFYFVETWECRYPDPYDSGNGELQPQNISFQIQDSLGNVIVSGTMKNFQNF